MPLATCGEVCAYHRLAVSALEQAGRSYRVIFAAPTVVEVAAAVAAGFGVTALPRSQATSAALVVCDEHLLPKLPTVLCSIHVRAGRGDRKALEQLADGLAEILQAAPTPATARHAQSPVEGFDAAVGRRATGS